LADIIINLPELITMPEKAAVLFIMYLLLRVSKPFLIECFFRMTCYASFWVASE
jgi:hypothetical protein